MGGATAEVAAARRWGAATALVDDDEARRRLLAATERCILRRGTGRIRVEEVATEAGVSRSTVYRYFRSREDLLLGVLVGRVDAGMAALVQHLRDPDDAAGSLTELILSAADRVWEHPLTSALWSAESWMVVTNVDLTGEELVERIHHHLGPLLTRWQADGRVHQDLDTRETVRWMNATVLLLLSPAWSGLAADERRRQVDRYLVRALVTGAGT